MVGTIIGAIIVGAIVGALARLVLPGKQHISVLVTVVLGVVGSLVGTIIYHSLGGGDTKCVDWIALIIGVIVAAVLIVIYGNVTGKKQVR